MVQTMREQKRITFLSKAIRSISLKSKRFLSRRFRCRERPTFHRNSISILASKVSPKVNLKGDKTGPILGAYEFKIELTVNSAAEKDIDFLSLIKAYRQPSGDGGRYVFQMSANTPYGPPNFGQLTTF